ncbi:HDOD domain-containing protein [Shewanella maritima]|uniref:HDOD domain-containing protein n=1 Tax=Shewanella maritima TaxID=2520507 RepID=UPI00373554BE
MKAVSGQNRGTEYWTKRISNQEIPALCSTVRELEKLAGDDVSSLAKLGRSVMHDNALTSRILRVANSAIYNKGNNQISTVSRAAVVLGFDTIRNICITAKMLTSLLESKNLSPEVYQRLLKLMAQSFQSAMIARMMLGEHEESSREEAFIASLLYRIGEVAFWSLGDEQTVHIDKLLTDSNDENTKALIMHEMGTSFHQLSQGVARNWGLGDLLVKSLTDPLSRTTEIRCIYVSDQLAEIISAKKLDKTKLQKTLAQAASLVGVDQQQFIQRFIQCNQQTHKLAEAYGAKDIVEFIANGQDVIDKIADDESNEVISFEPNLSFQMAQIRHLTHAIINKTDFNKVMQIALDGILKGIGVDRCGVWLISRDRKFLEPRVLMGYGETEFKHHFHVSLKQQAGIFSECIEQKQNLLVSEKKLPFIASELELKLQELLPSQGFMIAPLMVESKVLGLFYADRHTAESGFNESDFESFCHLIQLANLSFTTSMK